MISPQSSVGSRRRTWIGLFAVCSISVAAVGWWYYRAEVANIRRETYRALAVIGVLKSDQIHYWRLEHRQNAERFAHDPLVAQAVAELLRDPRRQRRGTDLRKVLTLEQIPGVNDDAVLLYPNGHVLLTTEAGTNRVSAATAKAVASALAGNDAVLSELFAAPDGAVKIDAVAAMRDAAGRPIAVIVLRSNAATHLYRVIKDWPTPSRTAETELVERDGDDVLFLNNLQDAPAAALQLRLPLTSTNRSAVRAVLGDKGGYEGRDYADSLVLADLRAIPGSPWFLVNEIDAAEMLAGVRSRAGFIGIIATLCILLVGGATAFGYWRRQAGIVRDLHRSERDQRAAEHAFRTTLYSIGDAVVTTDTECLVREMNPAAEKLTGWPESEARGKPMEEVFRIVDASTRAAISAPARAVMRSGKIESLPENTVLVARDGSERRVADSAAPISDDHGAVTGVVLVFSDQTARRAAQHALAESEERIRLALEASSHAMYDLNVVTGELIVSPEYARMLGYDPTDFHENLATWKERIHPDDLEPTMRMHRDYLAGLLPVYSADYRHRTKTGEWRWYHSQAKVVERTPDGRPIRMLGTRTDITERKQAERALSTSEARYRSLFENMLDGFAYCRMIYDEQGRPVDFVYLDVNKSFERITGLKRVIGRPVSEIIPGIRETSPELFEAYGRVASTGVAETFEFDFKSQNQFLTISAFSPEKGTFVSVFDDVTEHKRSEMAQKHREAELQESQRIARIGSWEWEIASGAITWSDGLNLLLARDPGAPPPAFESLSRFYSPGSWERLDAVMGTAIATGASYDIEAEMIRDDGTSCWTTTRGEAVRGAEGAVVTLRGTVLDITERKRAEATLHLQGAALNAAANAIIITDRDGEIVWINEAFSTLSGYSEAEAVGVHSRSLVKSGAQDDAYYRRMWKTILAGGVWSGEITNRRKNGERYPEHLTITPVRNDHGAITHFVAIKRDLTEEKRLQAQFVQAQKMEGVGRLAGGIAHDFNNILTIITGTAELALLKSPEGESVTDLQEIRRSGERATELTRQLLAFSRAQILDPVVLNLNSVVAGMQTMLQRVLHEDVDLVVVAAAGLGNVLADRGQIEQVVLNLAINARDAMAGGGSLTIEMRNVELDEPFASQHATVTPGPYVMMAVSDTGVGMDEATRLHVFEPFFTTKEPGKGTGLGLSTVYGITKQSGGSIWVDTAPGKGTTFRIYLPRVSAAAQIVHEAVAQPAVPGVGTILVVEDDEDLRHVAIRMLETAGYTVLTAGDGDEALRVLAREGGRVQLLMTDMIMPGMSGWELTEQVAVLHPSVKFLYASGYTDEAIVRCKVLDRGERFIAKPYSVAELTGTVRSVLNTPKRLPFVA